jgi:hypothetical protein
MKKVLLIILAIVVCAVVGAVYVGHSVFASIKGMMASSCVGNCAQVSNGGPTIKGSGHVATENRSVAPFTAVRLEAPVNVVIDRTGTQSLSVTVDDNLLALFTTEVKDGTLYLGLAKDKSFQAQSAAFHVTVADLQGIEIRGSGDVKADHLEGPSLTVAIAGSGDVKLAGSVDDLAVSSKGSGDVDAGGLAAKHAKVVMSGSGDATINASDTLDVHMSGSGSLRYRGSPKLTQDVHGSGSVKPQ